MTLEVKMERQQRKFSCLETNAEAFVYKKLLLTLNVLDFLLV